MSISATPVLQFPANKTQPYTQAEETMGRRYKDLFSSIADKGGTTVSRADLQAIRSDVSERALFLDPECPFHYSETPFLPGQSSTAHVLQPAQHFAAGMTHRLYAHAKNPHKGIPICEDVLRGYIAAAFNAGYAAALDAEFAEAVAEQDPELGTR